MRRPSVLVLLAMLGAGCVTPALNMDLRFVQAGEGGPQTRYAYREPVNAVLVRGARLRFQKPSELLGAADTPSGGNPRLLMQAGRSVVPGDGVVLLGTIRTEQTGGSISTLVVVTVVLECAGANIDEPGELKGCKGYAMRVPRQWPGEVYAISSATVSMLPEGGTARGRMRAKGESGAFSVELDGELVASMLELQAPPAAAPAP